MRTGRGKTLFGKCTRSHENKRPLNQHVKRSGKQLREQYSPGDTRGDPDIRPVWNFFAEIS